MKTAMQELIEKLDTQIKKYAAFNNGEIDISTSLAKQSAESLLEKEKQQIIDAVNEGMSGTMDAKEYYNKTFTPKPQ